jgi:hypothetical protein
MLRKTLVRARTAPVVIDPTAISPYSHQDDSASRRLGVESASAVWAGLVAVPTAGAIAVAVVAWVAAPAVRTLPRF